MTEIQIREERDEQERLRHRYELADGLPHGESLLYDPDGWLAQRAMFAEGKLHGELVQYAAPAVAAAVLQYRNGKLEGPGAYYEKGKLRMSIEYRDGVQDGVTILFGDLGNPTSKAEYKAGKLDGLSEWYWPDGSVQRTAHYLEGMLDGELVDYDERGRVTERMIFELDVLRRHVRYKDGKAVPQPVKK